MNITPDYSFQQPIIKQTAKDICIYKKILLAAAAGSGKTNMIMEILDKEYFKMYPNNTVLILTHGQTILRSQWDKKFERVGTSFKHQVLDSKSTLDLSAKVFVAIPHFFSNEERMEIIKNVDLIIIDEAHQYFFAPGGMVEKIVDYVNPSTLLCMTGTPSPFIKIGGFKTTFISPSEVAKNGAYSPVSMELTHSPYSFQRNLYDNSGELKSSVKISTEQTYSTLDAMVKQLDQPELQKTMVICSSQAQAQDVEKYFNNLGYLVALSTSDTDSDSGAIKFFTEHDDCKILSVVNRGILGFDCPEIVNLLDLKCSYNPDVIMQYLARIFRPHPSGRIMKRYLRSINIDRIFDDWHIMNFMNNMMEPELFITYDGQMMDREIRMIFPPICGHESETIGDFFINMFQAVKHGRKLPLFELFNGPNNYNHGDVTLQQLRDYEKTMINQYKKREA